MKKEFIAIALACAATGSALAQSLEETLKARFIGRTGTASADQRVDEHDLSTPLGPGPKTGCHGDTFSAGVTINKIDVNVQGIVATVSASYSGKYTRQGWIKPCVQSPPPNGREDRNVSGTIIMTIKQIPFKNAEVSFGGVSGLGEVGDAGHMSNVFAIEAAKSALMSGM